MTNLPCAAMTVIAMIGRTDAHQAACLLRTALEGTVGVRLGFVEPNAPALSCATHLSDHLQQLRSQGMTHVILSLDPSALARRVHAGLRFSIAAPVGMAVDWPQSESLLSCADVTVLDLDELAPSISADVASKRAFTYSENKAYADLTARNLRLFPGHTEFEAVATGQIHRIHLPVCGGFAVYHALCALSCGLCLGLDLGQMARLLRVARGPMGCMEVLSIPAAYTVLLDHADELPRLERVLTTARSFTARRLACLLDKRCGRPMAELAGHLADRVLPFDSTQTARRQAIVRGLDWARPGDVLVLTGTDGGPRERDFIRACAHSCALRRKSHP